jgi:hypothetical protein
MAEGAAEAGQPEAFANFKPWKLRALSASSSRGEHRFAQEVGLFRGVLLHRSNMKEILFFFQWHLFILVITQPYALLSPSNPSYRASACSAPSSAIAA